MDKKTEEKIAWVRLARTPSIGPVSFHKLIGYYQSAKNALKHVPEISRRGGAKKRIHIPSIKEVQDEINKTEAFGAKIILSCDADFPKLLKQIHSPPPLITIKGKSQYFEKPFLALVGSRSASAAGQRLAYTLAEELSHKGYLIISGMAVGIDSAAHTGALERATAAVLAGGIHYIYPKQNRDLYHKIAEKGLLISESHFNYAPKARDFPRRNRIISGLSLGVVIVEAALHSGSLITARLALEQNREVMALPGSPLDRRAKGSNRLIHSGSASLVETAEDIHNIIQGIYNLRLEEAEKEEYQTEPMTHYDQQEMDQARNTLFSLLSFTPIHMDELITQTGLSPAILSMALLELELAGRIEWTPGNLILKSPENTL